MAPPEVDEVWHAHLLDSLPYSEDCRRIFGAYLHHDPCLGAPDRAAQEDTLSLYAVTFGDKPGPIWSEMMTCAKPGGGCGCIYA
jgi:hypothetical protein